MTDPARLRAQLKAVPAGLAGWKIFEEVCTDILTYLFVPPLAKPVPQGRSYSGIDRRDAIFANRNHDGVGNWVQLYKELGARMILFEFKNYDTSEVGKDEVNQTRNYLSAPMGRLAILCSNKMPNGAAHQKRNTIYSEEKKVILFIGPDQLNEMMAIKERGDDPSDLILDLVEMFYIQHE